jgi:hypothetical protein
MCSVLCAFFPKVEWAARRHDLGLAPTERAQLDQDYHAWKVCL